MRTHRTDPQTSRKSQRPAASKPPVVAASSKSKLVHVLTRFALSSFVQPPNAWVNHGCFRTVLDRLGNLARWPASRTCASIKATMARIRYIVITSEPAIVPWSCTGAANIDGCRSKKRTGETAQMTAGARRSSRTKCVPLRVDLLTDSRSS